MIEAITSEVAKAAPDRAALMGKGSAVHVYDGNGDEVLAYTAGVGWHEKESKAETQVHGALKAAFIGCFLLL